MEGAPLSEVEGKMLYLSEAGHALPDMEVVRDAFERYHDLLDYEERISGLIRSVRERDRAGDHGALKAWDHAVHMLGRDDHYMLSLIQASGKSFRPRLELLKFLLAAVVIIGLSVAVAYYLHIHSL
jgi:hypothetical protein